MKGWVFGTILVIGGGFMGTSLKALDFSNLTCGIFGGGISTIGFLIQMYFAFRKKWEFEHGLKKRQEEHERLMIRAKELPPREAIALLIHGTTTIEQE